MNESLKKHFCPCCGYRTLEEPNGNYEICHVCRWEDDPSQSKNPDMGGGANRPSLKQAQKNYKEFGATEEIFLDSVRKSLPEEARDSSWKWLG